MCGFISGLSIQFHGPMCQFLCKHSTVLITMALYHSFILGSLIVPKLFFFLRIIVTMWSLLWFHIKFWNIFSSSVKYIIGILNRNCVEYIDGFGSYGYFLNIYLVLERGEGKVRGRETLMYGYVSYISSWGPGPQPRHVPWLGFESMTFQFIGWHSTHWAMPFRADLF